MVILVYGLEKIYYAFQKDEKLLPKMSSLQLNFLISAITFIFPVKSGHEELLSNLPSPTITSRSIKSTNKRIYSTNHITAKNPI